MGLRNRLMAYVLSDSGATAVESGLVLPIVIMLMLGVVSFSMLGGAINGMHYAVEEAARCFAVNKTTCTSAATAAQYASSKYLGPDVNPVFEASNVGCGFTVSGTATYAINLIVTRLNVPISASSCYPGKTAT